MKHFTALLLSFAVCVLCSPQSSNAAEIPGSTFRSGNWTGNANTNNRGTFQYCSVGRIYQNGYGLNFSLSKYGEAILSVYSPQGNFRGEKSFKIGAVIDNQRRFVGVADVLQNEQGNYASAIMATPEEFIQAIRMGNSLTISSYLGNLKFHLKGTARALKAAADCVNRFE
jgi:hypothetical protein